MHVILAFADLTSVTSVPQESHLYRLRPCIRQRVPDHPFRNEIGSITRIARPVRDDVNERHGWHAVAWRSVGFTLIPESSTGVDDVQLTTEAETWIGNIG